MLKLEQLTKLFTSLDSDKPAVNQVSLEVNQGESCILLGPPGGGKTTILKMINRMISATTGTIYLQDQDIASYDIFELRHRIGYVTRRISLFPHLTVVENLSIIPKLLRWDEDKTYQRINDLLEMVGLNPATLRDQYPKTLSLIPATTGGYCARTGYRSPVTING